MSDSRERFEALMRSRDETYLYRRDSPGCERYGEYCRQNIQDQWEVFQAAERDALERAAKVCEWKQDTDYETEIWHTSCGEAFVFNDGGPEENFLKFCCYCGGRLTAIRALAGKE
jgi:hypothetical protein